MSWSRLRRFAPAVLCFVLILPMFAMGGCRSMDDLSSRMDEASLQRLATLPEQGSVLAACRFPAVPDTLPALGAGSQELGRSARAVLIEVPREDLARLGEFPGATAIAVWGDENTKTKLDPRLRLQLLQAWGEEDPAPLEMIASFQTGERPGLREDLEILGASVRTVAGPVVTLDANPETIFRLLALPDLLRLQKPRTLNLLDGQ